MKSILLAFACLIMVSAAWPKPPASVGFMTGPNSALYVCWVHPVIHFYERVLDTSASELPLIPGDEIGRYAVAGRISFPLLSFVKSFSVNVWPEDLYPEHPGDRYSPFGYGVYADDQDTGPASEPIIDGTNALCDGVPCADEWAENEISLFNPAGDAWWVAFEWADSTPTAPQLICLSPVPDGSSNVIGVHDGFEFQWNSLSVMPVFQLHLLGMAAPNLSQELGWQPVPQDQPAPEAFQIQCYSGRYRSDSIWIGSTDTLFHKLPDREIDSVQVYSMYGGMRDDEYAVAQFRTEDIAPIVPEIVLIGFFGEYADMQLVITNVGGEPIGLAVGYSERIMTEDTAALELPEGQSKTVSFQVPVDLDSSAGAMIILQDIQRVYYPHLIPVPAPDTGQTDIDQGHGEEAVQPIYLKLYPNPFTQKVYISAPGIQLPSTAHIYNILGQRVTSVELSPGAVAEWDSRGAPAGVYFVQMANRDIFVTRQVILLGH